MTDRKIVLAVVVLLGCAVLGGLGGLIYLIALDKPSEALAILSGHLGSALGALGALLVSTRSSGDPAQDVNVVNATKDPIPVDQAPPGDPDV